MGKSQPDFTEGFDLPDVEAWASFAASSLKGKDLDRVLTSQPAPDLKVLALRTGKNSKPAAVNARAHGPWEISAAFWNPDARSVNEEILEDLSRGVTSISLKIASGATPGIARGDLAEVLDGVYLDMIRTGFAAGEESAAIAHQFADYVASSDLEPQQVRGNIGADPIGTLAQTGRLHVALEAAIDEAVDLVPMLAKRLPNVAALSANGSIYHSAGASDAMELGYILSTATAYFRAADAKGIGLDAVARSMQLGTAVGAETFLNIAKMRALRGLWDRLLSALDVADCAAWINAGSALRMMTRRDPWVNILRGTSACFSGGVGGADSVTILPLDTLMGLPGKLGRRLARNTQIMLQEESYLTAVADPAKGSFAIEAMTNDLMTAAWSVFQDVEASGGMAAALRSGKIHEDCANVAQQRQAKFAKRKQVVTGVSQFALLDEKLPDDVRGYPEIDVSASAPAGEELTSLPLVLDAGAFEAVRTSVEQSNLPTVPLLCLGDQARYSGRANFTRDVMAAVGFKTEIVEISSPEDAQERLKVAGCAVICGADSAYETEASPLVKSLSGHGYLLMAGKPENYDALMADGLQGAIFMGMDVIEFGADLLSRLAGEE